MALATEIADHIDSSVLHLLAIGVSPDKTDFVAQCNEAALDIPTELDHETDTPELDQVMRIENRLVKRYVDYRVDAIEKKREASKDSKFAQLTMSDRIADCCYQRAIRMLFALPEKPNRIIFDRFEREPQGLATFVELDKYMKGVAGYDDLSAAIDSPAWPIIKACLDQLGFKPSWGRNPQKPWEGGGRSAAESTTTANTRAGGSKRA